MMPEREFIVPANLEEASKQGHAFGLGYLIASRKIFERDLDEYLAALEILIGASYLSEDLLDAFELAARKASECGGP